MKPAISILLPVINCESFIYESINSLLLQTYDNFELIIIIDPSIDNTLKIVQKIEDPRIIILQNKKRLGLAESLNIGLNIAQGRYIARADADDISFPNRLTVQLKYIEQKGVDLVGSKYVNENVETGKIEENNRRLCLPEDTKGHMFFYWITHGSLMFKKSMVSNLKKVYIDRPAEDYDLFVRLAKKHQFYEIPEILVKVRVRPDSLCGSGGDIIKMDIDKIRLHQLSELDIYPSNDEASIHLSFLDQNYIVLLDNNLKEVYAWIHKIIAANNLIKAFPNPYFNSQWQFRATRLLKYKNKKTISDICKFRYLSKKLGNSFDIKSLLYLYRYKYHNYKNTNYE